MPAPSGTTYELQHRKQTTHERSHAERLPWAAAFPHRARRVWREPLGGAPHVVPFDFTAREDVWEIAAALKMAVAACRTLVDSGSSRARAAVVSMSSLRGPSVTGRIYFQSSSQHASSIKTLNSRLTRPEHTRTDRGKSGRGRSVPAMYNVAVRLAGVPRPARLDSCGSSRCPQADPGQSSGYSSARWTWSPTPLLAAAVRTATSSPGKRWSRSALRSVM